MARRAIAKRSSGSTGNGGDGGVAAAVAEQELIQITTRVVSSFVANNSVPANEVPTLIKSVADTFRDINAPEPPQLTRKPAVSVKRSVTPDYIVCLEDGRKLKMLKRHLRTAYNMSPGEYRDRWGLPPDYPMVAPNYAKQRSKLAKKFGLGRR